MMDILSEIVLATTLIQDYDQLLQWVMEKVCQALQVEAGSLLLINEEDEDLVFKALVGEKSKKLINARIPVGEGICGWVAKNAKPALAEPAERDPRFRKEVDAHTGFTTRAVLCVPMEIHNKVIGVIELLNKRDGHTFTEEDVELLKKVASQVAIIIENATLYQELCDLKEYFESIMESMISGFIAIDQRGVVTTFNRQASQILGLPKEELIGCPLPHSPLAEILKKVLKTDNTETRGEIRVEVKDRGEILI